MVQNIKLEPIDINNPDHVGWLYKVRAHPEVAAHFFAPPPTKFIDHVQFLTRVMEKKERDFFIVSADGQMCGYCQIINHPDHFEVGFALHPDWWGKGIGNISVELLLDHLRRSGSKNAHNITLVVRKDNERAIKLYKKYGFELIGEHDSQLTMKLKPQN
jgi:RimJ/RimL family protein N-acetyltransferase